MIDDVWTRYAPSYIFRFYKAKATAAAKAATKPTDAVVAAAPEVPVPVMLPVVPVPVDDRVLEPVEVPVEVIVTVPTHWEVGV